MAFVVTDIVTRAVVTDQILTLTCLARFSPDEIAEVLSATPPTEVRDRAPFGRLPPFYGTAVTCQLATLQAVRAVLANPVDLDLSPIIEMTGGDICRLPLRHALPSCEMWTLSRGRVLLELRVRLDLRPEAPRHIVIDAYEVSWPKP